MRNPIGLIALSLALSACTTGGLRLPYTPTSAPAKISEATTAVELVNVTDTRKAPPNRLGVIRDGFGIPLKVLESDLTTADLVRESLAAGLRARGVNPESKGAQTRLSATVRRLDANQYVRREAHAELEVRITDASGQTRWTRVYVADATDGSIFALDTSVFASVEDLRKLLEKTLTEAVDKALDDPALRAALKP
jgi:hypothetical protein